MQDTNNSLMVYAKLAGLRVNVIANRALCGDDISRSMHDRLIEGLDRKIVTIRQVENLQRAPVNPEEPDDRDYYIAKLGEEFSEPIALLDSLFIDHASKEYMVNDGAWQFGYDVESGCTDYPSEVYLQPDELSGLHPILQELSEIGVNARAYWVKESWELGGPEAGILGPAI